MSMIIYAMIAAGIFVSSSNSPRIALMVRDSGPVLKARSENATAFQVKIDSASVIEQADEGGYIDLDLFTWRLQNGKHDVAITPFNIYGEGPTLSFGLQITGKKPQLWQIIPDVKLFKSSEAYRNCFSGDLLIYIMP